MSVSTVSKSTVRAYVTAAICLTAAVSASVIALALPEQGRLYLLIGLIFSASLTAAIYLISRKPINGLYLIIGAMPLDVVGRFDIGVPITIFNIVIVATIAAWLINQLRRKESVFYGSPLDWPLALLVLAVAMSIPLSYSKPDSILSFARVVAEVLFFLFITNNVRKEKDARRVMHWVIATGVFFALFALAQYFVPGLRIGTVGSISNLGVKRVGGFFHDPNFFASFLSVSFLMAFALSMRNSGRERLFTVLSSSFLAIALILTFSRTAWSGTLAGIVAALVLFREPRLKKMLVAVLVVVILALAIPSPVQSRIISVFNMATDASSRSRFGLMISTIELIRDHPLFGVGMGAFSTAYPAYRILGVKTALVKPHQLLLTMWAEAGILGIVSILLVFFAWLRLWRGKREPTEVAAAAAVFALVFENFFYYFLYNDYLWLSLGLSVACWSIATRKQGEKSVEGVQIAERQAVEAG